MYPNAEEVGLKISLGGGILFALLGLIMAAWSKSQLVLLDGSYSMLDSFFTFLILKVSLLIGEDRSKKVRVEYWKDFFLILRSVAIIVFLSYLFRENVRIILSGGKAVDVESVGLYTFISVIGGLVFLYYINYWSKKTNSRVLKLEKKGWMIDTLLSASIAVSLVISLLIKGSDYDFLRVYLEQIFVIIIVIVNFPYPVIVIKESMIKIINNK